jgi:putative hydrolase of the HAD superfamily
MNLPKMILFDYGHTLLYEPGCDTLRGTEAMMRYATANPQGYSAEQINHEAARLHEKLITPIRKINLDCPNICFQRLLYEKLEISFCRSIEELDAVFFEACSAGAIMPYALEMLQYLQSKGIRMGIVSNFSVGEASLKNRVAKLLPAIKFNFIMGSGAYGVRKPNPLIFELALKKAKLSASDVWFCGDSPTADVEGAAKVGIFPIWYEDLTVENPCREVNSKEPNCEHLHIHDYRELVEILEELI